MATLWVPAAARPACAGSRGGRRCRAGRPRACGCAARCGGGRPRAWSRRRRTGRAPPPRCWDSDAVLPPPQPGQPVAQQGQLDLGLALLAGGVLGEDVEDHRGAVDGRAAEDLLEVALLGRAELVVEDDGVAVDRLRRVAQLLGLALADVGGRVGRLAALHDAVDHVGAGRVDQRPPARRGRPRCPPRWPGGSVTPASTMRSRKVRSMKPPDSPPCSPKAERCGIRSRRALTTSTSAMWVAGPTNVIVSPSSTCTSPPSMATVTRSPTRSQVCAACGGRAGAGAAGQRVARAPLPHAGARGGPHAVAAIHSTLMPPVDALLDERPVGVDVDGQHVVDQEHEVGVAHVDGDRRATAVEHELARGRGRAGPCPCRPGPTRRPDRRWPRPGRRAGRRRWRSAGRREPWARAPRPGPGSGCRCRSSRPATRRR